MSAVSERSQFNPPPPPGLLRAIGLALLAHLLLALALGWGIRWQRQSQDLAVEAELWASVPVKAAPALVEAPAPPPPQAAEPAPPPPAPPVEADIAAEKARAKQREQQKAEEEAARQRRAEQARARKEDAKRLAQAEKAEKAEKVAKAASAARAAREAQEAKAMEAERQNNLRRIQGLAGGTGAPDSSGTAARSAGPSSSYAGRVVARVRPNVAYTETSGGNPAAEVEVRLSPDGTILSRRIVKSSGLPAWDEAVLRALDRTEVLPRDTDGRAPSSLLLSFRPRD